MKTYENALNHYNGYVELYVPQVTYKDDIVKGYPLTKFLVENTIEEKDNKIIATTNILWIGKR